MTTLITTVAAALHDDWRAPRLLSDGTFEPRWKDDNTVDIANTEFQDLPAKWQGENLAAAEQALAAVTSTPVLEEAAASVHIAWLDRNGAWAPAEQQLEYHLLAEGEKEKDRVVARIAAAAAGITLK